VTDAPLPQLPLAADPSVPEVTLDEFPVWMREPAKIVGWIVTALAGVLSLAAYLLSDDVLSVLPEGWTPTLRTAAAVVAVSAFVLGRIQTWLTRNGLGERGNGFDGVWSPAATAASQAEVAAVVAAAKAVDPETHAR
jgi:hypothetical protein